MAPPAPAPRLWPLAWPLFIEIGLGMAIGVLGTAMAARQGDSAGAAFALAHHVLGMLFIFFRIIGAGIAAVLAQNLGAGRRAVADAVARAALGASSWIGSACMLAALAGAPLWMLLFNAPADVRPLAQPFLQWLAPALLFDAWNASMAAVMRSHLRARDALAVVLAMHATHLLLMLWWMPAFGLPGFALALLASRVLGLALHLALWRLRLQLRPAAADFWRLPRAELAALLHIGLPGAAENIAYRLSFTVSMAVVGGLGAQALATHAYVTQISAAALLFGLATGFSVEILVAHLVGAGRLHEARRLVKRALGRSLLVSVLVTGAVALAAPWLLARFTQDGQIVALGATLLLWQMLLEPGRTFNIVVINALRAAGDARFPVLVGAGSMVVVLAGGSWLLGQVLGLGLVGVWIAYAADEWLRGLIMWQRWQQLGWVPHARRARRRLARAG